MEFKKEDIAALRNDTVLTSYSPYLAVKAANKKKVSRWLDDQKITGKRQNPAVR